MSNIDKKMMAAMIKNGCPEIAERITKDFRELSKLLLDLTYPYGLRAEYKHEFNKSIFSVLPELVDLYD